MKILFICTGNTCRSPMAEGLFNKEIKESPLLSESYISYSAGIMAIDDDSASNNAILALKEDWDIDISAHKAKPIRYDYIKSSYLILTMTKAHKFAVLKLFPEMKSRVFTLKEYAANIQKEVMLDQHNNDLENKNQYELLNKYSFDFDYDFNIDIPDPYGKPLEIYKYCARDIKKAVDIIIKDLKIKAENT